MNQDTKANVQSNWGQTKGEAQSNKITYTKFNNGRNHIRIVGDILRRYCYWLENKDGQRGSFENLDFCRDTESFQNNGLNPIKELGLQSTDFLGKPEFNKDGSPKPLGSKKSYLVPIINRSTNQLEYMELKKGIFDGVNEVMQKVNDPRNQRKFVDGDYRVPNPSFIDVVFAKTGEGINTEYKVDIMDTMDFVMDPDMYDTMKGAHQADALILKDVKPITEVFPRQTYDEQKAAVAKFLAGKSKEATPQAPAAKTDFAQYDNEAMNELDD